MSAIPASAIVNVNPGVIAAGGTGLDLNGLLLTVATRVPIGQVLAFSSAATVSAYFGPSAAETTLAQIYFRGPDNSTISPAALLFAQYNAAAVAGYLRGGSLASLTLTQLQALSGVLTVSVDGVSKTSTTINLSAATSFSNAATIITAGFTSLGAVVAFDSVASAFTFTSSTTGASSSLTFATGSLSAGLKLTAATGAVLSAGAVAATPATAMAAIASTTQNWASFATVFEPLTADKVAFAAWNNSTDDRFEYVMWDSDATVTTSASTTSAGYAIAQANYSGTFPIWSPTDASYATFVLSCNASLDFTRTNGRKTLAFRNQSGLAAAVTSQAVADQLIANGYNFYGAYATANDQFVFLYPGSVSGPYLWADSYVNQIWLNNEFQLALMVLLTQASSIPYNASGYGMIEAALLDPIIAALNFGAIRAGVTLSASQIAEVNAAAGQSIDATLSERGWYLLIQDAAPAVRAARGSPPMTFFYMDGQSVQALTLASIQVQ